MESGDIHKVITHLNGFFAVGVYTIGTQSNEATK